LTAQFDCRIAFEVDRLFQQLFYFRHAFINALRIQSVNLVGRLERSQENVPGHGVAILRGDGVNVFLRKKEMAEIEHFQICLQEFLRNFLAELLPGIMAFLQEPPDRHCHRFSRTRR
jgi:hypothetical protein